MCFGCYLKCFHLARSVHELNELSDSLLEFVLVTLQDLDVLFKVQEALVHQSHQVVFVNSVVFAHEKLLVVGEHLLLVLQFLLDQRRFEIGLDNVEVLVLLNLVD